LMNQAYFGSSICKASLIPKRPREPLLGKLL
jgi:hypothetical protein